MPSSDVVACDGEVGVARIEVRQDPGSAWRIWVVSLDPDCRCPPFEEWSFTPRQPDGHARTAL